jgi:hypothetical protein
MQVFSISIKGNTAFLLLASMRISHGDDLELDGVAISRRIVPMRQVIEAVVNHPQRAAQVLLPLFPRARLAKLVVMRVLSDG